MIFLLSDLEISTIISICLQSFALLATVAISFFTIRAQRKNYEHQKSIDRINLDIVTANLELQKVNTLPFVRISLDLVTNSGITPHSRRAIIKFTFITNTFIILHDMYLESIKNSEIKYRGEQTKEISKRIFFNNLSEKVYANQEVHEVLSFMWSDYDEYKKELKDLADNYRLVFRFSNTITKEGKASPYIHFNQDEYIVYAQIFELKSLNNFI